ncbi:MAG: glycoside hydrolase family 99-like domain-containing protein [Clostridia bacterium]|nr:glycoside hydrolase family 99-like domain-containing protein [Clostridia bacterium]
MKKSRKVLCFLLACIIAFSVTVGFLPAQAAAGTGGTTELFAGNAAYILQERFAASFTLEANGSTNNAVLSGWDVDYRGGSVTVSGGNATITDSNGYEKITLNKKLMSHSGDNLVLETAFSYSGFVDDGVYYKIAGNGKTSLYLVIDGGYICIQKPDGTYQRIMQWTADTVYCIKAEFSASNQNIALWINGTNKGTFAYRDTAYTIDEIEIGTGVEEVSKIILKYVYMYVNYAVNETFMAAAEGSVPGWWTASGTGSAVAAAPGAPYKADPNGFSLAAGGTLQRSFDIADNKISLTWEMLIPSAGADGLTVFAGSGSSNSVNLQVNNGKFSVNGTNVYTYTNNVWYKIELKSDGGTVDVYVNNILRAENISAPASGFDYISFVNSSANAIMLDNISVCKTFEASDFADYTAVPEVAQSDYNIGMVIYPMWREGIHYGWDAITPYEERTPYLGYYTGGSREVADWDNKWLLEHGVDHAIFPFARPDITEAGGTVNFSVRGEALHDGYQTSEYKNQLDFAVMICSASASNYTSGAEFIENVQPFLVEHYFKNPSYKSIDNRLLVYSYDFDNIAECLGGDDQLDLVLDSLNTAAKTIGNGNGGTYDGIVFMADISATAESYVNTYISTYSSDYGINKWRYTWGSDKYANIINGIKNDYANGSNTVASIPMGFDNTPWRYNDIGFISPDGIKSICDAVVANKGSDDPNLVVFTCWDEWGEGHFFAPSDLYGFDYLNVIRSTFTTLGTKTDEERPTEDAVKRMGVLHPEGRQILKIKKDSVNYTADDLSKLTSLGSKALLTERGSSISNCSRSSKMAGNIYTYNYTFTVTGSPATVTYNFTSPSIDASQITAIRINGYAENSAEMVLYIQTDKSGTIDNTDFRFSGRCDGTTTASDVILLPDNPDALTGTIQKIRFNPSANTSNGSQFQLSNIEFYTGNIYTKVLVDTASSDTSGNITLAEQEYELVSPVEISDTAYIPAYQFLLNLSAYPVWDKATQTLTVEKDGTTAVLTAGSNVMNINGEDVTLDYAPYYSEGNLFIPYSGVLDYFGYSATYDEANRTIKYTHKDYENLDSYVKGENCWEFNIDGYDEGWEGSGVFTPMTVKGGMLHMASNTSDPIITKNGLSIPKSDALYAVLRIKKTDKAEAGMLRLYDDAMGISGVVYSFNLNASDEIQEFVFDLTKDYTANSVYTNKYEDLAGTITKLRLDPMDNTGSIYIDSIRILKEKPNDFDYTIKAYGWEEENLLQLDTDKNQFVYTNTYNCAGTTIGTELPATETVDGYENVIKLVPISGANNCIFTLEKAWYNGSKQWVSSLCTDNRVVKISFWYKGIGSFTGLNFENRMGGSRDGEEFAVTDVSNTEWKYYENYIDLTNETTTGGGDRWLSLRVLRNGTAATDGGVYLRDYKMVCLNESDTITSFGGDTVAVSISKVKETETEPAAPAVYVASYSAEGNTECVTGGSYPRTVSVTNASGTTTETARYYYLRPSDNSTSIKGFFWEEMLPLSEVLIIKK